MPVALFDNLGRKRHRAHRLITRSLRPSETTAATAASTPLSSKNGLSILHFTSADPESPEQRGDLAIIADGDDVEHVDYHFRGQWFDSLSLYWREFARAGRLRERRYDKPRATRNMFQQPEHGTLAVRVRVAPGETRQVRFAISWNYPLGSIYWFNRDQPGSPPFEGTPPTWKNYYATQWADSTASGA